MNAYIEQLKNLIEELETYERLTSEAEAEFEKNPMDLKAEHLFDVYYTKEHNAFMNAVSTLKVLIKCDDCIAKEMINSKRNEIKRLFA